MIVGDGAISKNAEERAGWLEGIIYQLVANAGLEELKAIYSFARGICIERQVCQNEAG